MELKYFWNYANLSNSDVSTNYKYFIANKIFPSQDFALILKER